MPGQGTGFEKPTEKKMLTYDDFMARLDAHEADPKNPPVYWKASNFASFVRVTPAGGGTEQRWWGSASLMARLLKGRLPTFRSACFRVTPPFSVCACRRAPAIH